MVPFNVGFGASEDAYSPFLKLMESVRPFVPSGIWTDSCNILKIEADEFGTGKVGDEVAVVDVVRVIYK